MIWTVLKWLGIAVVSAVVIVGAGFVIEALMFTAAWR